MKKTASDWQPHKPSALVNKNLLTSIFSVQKRKWKKSRSGPRTQDKRKNMGPKKVPWDKPFLNWSFLCALFTQLLSETLRFFLASKLLLPSHPSHSAVKFKNFSGKLERWYRRMATVCKGRLSLACTSCTFVYVCEEKFALCHNLLPHLSHFFTAALQQLRSDKTTYFMRQMLGKVFNCTHMTSWLMQQR